MKYAMLLVLIIILLSACSPVPFNAQPTVLKQLAPEVPAIGKKSQKQAAYEMQGRQCPMLNAIANACLLTRDEARILIGK